MRLCVLAGGFGARLKTVVADVPKALASVGGVPFLQLQLENWVLQGLHEFTFLLHHQAGQIINFLREQQVGILRNCDVDWSIESTPMDTGGAIAYAVKELNLNGRFLTTNADTWLGGGIQELSHAAPPAMAVVNSVDVGRYGSVHFDHNARVTSFSEKKQLGQPGWINGGLYHLTAELFKNWDGKPFSLERGLLGDLVQGCQLAAVPLHTNFIDIGVPDDYHRFCRWIELGRQSSL